jgi:hypothetical protein
MKALRRAEEAGFLEKIPGKGFKILSGALKGYKGVVKTGLPKALGLIAMLGLARSLGGSDEGQES